MLQLAPQQLVELGAPLRERRRRTVGRSDGGLGALPCDGPTVRRSAQHLLDLRPDPLQHREDLRHEVRSEEHTSELQSLAYLVCRLLLEKKKTQFSSITIANIQACD